VLDHVGPAKLNVKKVLPLCDVVEDARPQQVTIVLEANLVPAPGVGRQGSRDRVHGCRGRCCNVPSLKRRLQLDDRMFRGILINAEAIHGLRCATCDPLDHGTERPVQILISGAQSCVALLQVGEGP
jgi:hypothetical protein